jgi:hypothetical protein
LLGLPRVMLAQDGEILVIQRSDNGNWGNSGWCH